MSLRSNVRSAHDSRSSSDALTKTLQDAVETVEGNFYDYGLFTTPQLHYVIRCLNNPTVEFDAYYGVASEEGYFDKMSKAFIQAAQQSAIGRPFVRPKHKVIVDCACGVGGPKLEELSKRLVDYLNIEVRNSSVEDPDNNLNVDVSDVLIAGDPPSFFDNDLTCLSSVVPISSRPRSSGPAT